MVCKYEVIFTEACKKGHTYKKPKRLFTDPKNVTNIKTDIMKAMRNLSYFAIKSELSFKFVPALLATVIKCKVELGNINHSPEYVVKYLECLDWV